METSDVQQQQQPSKKQNTPSSSPEAAETGFVMVPPSLAGDSSKHKTNQVTQRIDNGANEANANGGISLFQFYIKETLPNPI